MTFFFDLRLRFYNHFSFTKNTRLLLLLPLFFLPNPTKAIVYSCQANVEINYGISVIGTCQGINAAHENSYNITILGLNPLLVYNFDLNGDGINEVINFTGATNFITSIATKTNIPFIDGTNYRNVGIDIGANGQYDIFVQVHEVLCTDADNDGNLDFKEGIDKDLAKSNNAYIVATMQPYNGTNVYVYVLTNTAKKALAANTVGLFTNLAVGDRSTLEDYYVLALNFSDKASALSYIESLYFDLHVGTDMNLEKSFNNCMTFCGIKGYNIFTAIPTMNQWGLLIFTLLLLNLGVGLIYRLEKIT